MEEETLPPEDASAGRDRSRASETGREDSAGEWELCGCLAPAQEPGELGRLGPYRVLEVLGAGGMGVVYRAEEPARQRIVALKVLLPAPGPAAAQARQRFLHEARAAGAVRHENVVAIYQVGEERGVPYLAMELLKGLPLDRRLRHEPRLPPAEVVRIGRETGEGLSAAHACGVVHGDVKPGNLWLMKERGRIKILDFGLARSAGERPGGGAPLLGTPAYMAPEQVSGKPMDGRSDLFSLGCVLYRMSTGVLPFRGPDAISTLVAVTTRQPKPPRVVHAEVPAALSELILHLLAKEPAGRPRSARAVADALRAMSVV